MIACVRALRDERRGRVLAGQRAGGARQRAGPGLPSLAIAPTPPPRPAGERRKLRNIKWQLVFWFQDYSSLLSALVFLCGCVRASAAWQGLATAGAHTLQLGRRTWRSQRRLARPALPCLRFVHERMYGHPVVRSAMLYDASISQPHVKVRGQRGARTACALPAQWPCASTCLLPPTPRLDCKSKVQQLHALFLVWVLPWRHVLCGCNAPQALTMESWQAALTPIALLLTTLTMMEFVVFRKVNSITNAGTQAVLGLGTLVQRGARTARGRVGVRSSSGPRRAVARQQCI